MMSASGFKWVGNSRVYELFSALTSFAVYPKSIFSKGIQILLTAVIPLSLMGFFPASVLLKKSVTGLFISLGSCALLFVFSIFFWYRMLRTYTSAGG
jgi:ABC-2 type transport system permease protein